MKSYVEGLLDSELPRAVKNISAKMLGVTETFSKANATSNSRIFIAYQTAILEGIEEYGALLRQRLAQFDPAHAPLSDTDFDEAIASIEKLKDEALKLYEKKREYQKPFGGSSMPIDELRLNSAVNGAKNELAGLQASYRSSRSTTSNDWVSAANAVKMLAPILTASAAQKRICERAHNGLIQARAESYRVGTADAVTDADIPTDFWWAEGEAALKQNWPTGDFSTWIDQRIHLRAFGVAFRRADIEKMLPAPQHDVKIEMAMHNEEDVHLISQLEAVVPSAALSYDQAIRDLRDDDRISFRGPALELREALREVLDHLAPDDEVTGAPGYEPEKDQYGNDRNHPTMKQKVRFIMKTKRSSSAAPEQAVTAFNESIASLTRAVYELGSKATHVAGERQAVSQLRRYVVVILHDILAA